VRATPDPDVAWVRKNEDGKLDKVDFKTDKRLADRYSDRRTLKLR